MLFHQRVLQHSGSDDVSYVDMTLFLVTQVGILLDEIFISHKIHASRGRSNDKFAATSCVSKHLLCLQYAT